MICIAVVNTKGGVGKTTLSCALAVRAAKDSPRVAMVDLDPQRSLCAWWQRRGSPENPAALYGVETAKEAMIALEQTGWDWVFLDGPPAFLTVIQEMIAVADLVVIPVIPSAFDLMATQDAVVLAREEGVEFICVFNNVTTHEKKLADSSRAMLFNSGVPIAQTVITNRVAHKSSATVGKTAPEVSNGKPAADEIEALWIEIKAQALLAAKRKGVGRG